VPFGKKAAQKAEDVCLFTENDEHFYMDCFRSRSNRFLFMHLRSAITTEVYYMRLPVSESMYVCMCMCLCMCVCVCVCVCVRVCVCV